MERHSFLEVTINKYMFGRCRLIIKIYIHQFRTAESLSKVASLSGHSGWILSLLFSPNGLYFASSSSDRTVNIFLIVVLNIKVRIWKTGDFECLVTLRHHTGAIWGLGWNDDGDRLATTGDDGSIIIYKSLSAQ